MLTFSGTQLDCSSGVGFAGEDQSRFQLWSRVEVELVDHAHLGLVRLVRTACPVAVNERVIGVFKLRIRPGAVGVNSQLLQLIDGQIRPEIQDHGHRQNDRLATLISAGNQRRHGRGTGVCSRVASSGDSSLGMLCGNGGGQVVFAILFSVEVQSGGEQVQVCIFHGQSQLRQRCGAGVIRQEFRGHEWAQ